MPHRAMSADLSVPKCPLLSYSSTMTTDFLHPAPSYYILSHTLCLHPPKTTGLFCHLD